MFSHGSPVRPALWGLATKILYSCTSLNSALWTTHLINIYLIILIIIWSNVQGTRSYFICVTTWRQESTHLSKQHVSIKYVASNGDWNVTYTVWAYDVMQRLVAYVTMFVNDKLWGGDVGCCMSWTGFGQRDSLAALYYREKTPGTLWIWSWAGLWAGLDTEARRKIHCLFRGSNTACSVCSQTLYWLSCPSSSCQPRQMALWLEIKYSINTCCCANLSFWLFDKDTGDLIDRNITIDCRTTVHVA
jgi:hypothetical protein